MAGAEALAVIGIGASVIQVIDCCNKVLGRIHEFRQTMAFHDIELQLPLLMKDIERLSLPEYRQLINKATKQALVRVLKGCRRQINALDQLIQRLTPALAASKLQRTWKGIKSLGKDTKLREILGILSEYKATITLHLSSRQARAFANVKAADQNQKSYFEVSAQKFSLFVGRKLVLNRIRSSIACSEANPRIIVLTGVGGQGKTQVALEFCHKSSSDFHAVFWVDASPRESATRSFENIAAKISLNGQTFSDSDSKIRFVKDILRGYSDRWVLVFDNYDDPRAFNDITSFFPTSSGRAKNAILVTREDLEHGREIVKRLGYLPLAIDQASAYISIRQLSLQIFLDHYEKRKEVILGRQHAPPEYNLRGSDASNNSELNLSVLTTWELSFEQIGDDEKEREIIGKFLTQSAFFNPTSINEGIFRSYFESREWFDDTTTPWMSLFSTGEAWDPFLFQDVVAGLRNHSLIQNLEITSQETKFSMHPLIKDWLQLRNSARIRCHYTSTAISMCHCLLQEQEVEAMSLRTRQASLGHIDACMENYAQFMKSSSEKEKYGGLVEGFQTTFATFYGRHDRYTDAERLFLESMECQNRELGEMNLSTLRTMNNLAAMYLDQRKGLLGPENPITLNTVNNLGNLYAMQSLFDKALGMYTRTLEGYQSIYGRNHRTVIEAENNLGEVAMKLGRLEEAMQRFATALMRLSNPEDTDLSLYIKSNIAVILKLQGRYQEAIELYDEVIKGRELLRGSDHSSTLTARCELGDVYRASGQLEKAETWYTRGKAKSYRKIRTPMEGSAFEATKKPTTTECFSMLDQSSSSILATRCEMGSSYERARVDDPPSPSLGSLGNNGRRRMNELSENRSRAKLHERTEQPLDTSVNDDGVPIPITLTMAPMNTSQGPPTMIMQEIPRFSRSRTENENDAPDKQEPDEWDEIPERKGRALLNKKLAVSKLSRVFSIINQSATETETTPLSLPDPNFRAGIPKTCPSRTNNPESTYKENPSKEARSSSSTSISTSWHLPRNFFSRNPKPDHGLEEKTENSARELSPSPALNPQTAKPEPDSISRPSSFPFETIE